MTSLTPTVAERNRQENAVNLAARHLAERNERHITARQAGGLLVWTVESQTRPGVAYTVTRAADGWAFDCCDCEDACYRHQECKHQKAVALLTQPAQPAAPAPAPSSIKWTADERRARKQRTELEEEI